MRSMVAALTNLIAVVGMIAPAISISAQRPTLHVEVRDITGDSRDGDSIPPSPQVELQWRAENCEYIMIFGTHPQKAGCTGSLSSMGTYVLIAVGPGGSTIQTVGAYVTMRPPGPRRPNGYNGASYSLQKDFKPEQLERQSFRAIIHTGQSIEAVRRVVMDVLQTQGFTVAEGVTKDSTSVVYTPAFAVQKEGLDLSAAASAKHRPAMWQVAYVVLIQPSLSISQKDIAVWLLPAVQVNFLRDNREWQVDPDGPLMTLPLSRDLVKRIQEKLE